MSKLTKKSSKKSILREWIAALRGEGEYKGLYKQGTGALRQIYVSPRKDRFCCLGVLCDLAEKAKVVTVAGITNDYNRCYAYGSTEEDGVLPIEVQEWAGIASHFGYFENKDGTEDSLADLNDRGNSFKKIAKVIESKPDGLFVA